MPSVRFPIDDIAAGSHQEIEIAAAIRLKDVLIIQFVIAACVLRFWPGARPFRQAALQFGIGYKQIQFASWAIKRDFVAVANDRNRSSRFGLWSDMKNDAPERRAAHARIRNPDHVLDAACE